MLLTSKTTPPYFPEHEQTTILRLGLHPLQHKDWLVVDEDFLQFQNHKLQMGQLHPDKVFRALPASRAAQIEFGDYLLDHLKRHHAHEYRINEDELIHQDSATHHPIVSGDLWQSSLWIQEDICLLEASDSGYVLSAASLCSPSNWKLEEKIGKTVDHIHDPVPGYQQELAERVNRLLKGIKPAKPLLRYNWSLQASSELCWREDIEQPLDSLHWRVERQTFLRLPQTGAIVFGIRLFIHSIETMAKLGDFEKSLQTIMTQLPEETVNYKGLNNLLGDFGIREGKK